MSILTRLGLRGLLGLAVVLTMMLQASLAQAAGCPDATKARLAGTFEAAEQAAHDCLAATPNDVSTWFELSRAVGYQKRFDDALRWIEQGLVRVPQDIDMRLWRVRLLGWMGRPDDAIAALDVMVDAQPTLLDDPETATLSANLRGWAKHDWSAQVTLSPRVALARGGVAEWDTRLGAWFRVGESLRLGVRGELHERRGEDTPVRDVIGYVSAAWYGDGWGLGAEAGLGVNAVAVPTTSVWIEPQVRLIKGLSTSLRYWRVDYEDAGAHVVMPGVRGTLGSWTLDLRYDLAFPDAEATTHAGLARLGWALAERWRVEIGGGAGSGSDYLQTTQRGSEGHVLGLVGVRWQVSDNYMVRAGYTWRRDDDGTDLLDRHEVQTALTITM